MELNDRVVVVTGGGSGIGEALARGAHRFGVRLWAGSVEDAYEDDGEGETPAS